MKTPQQRKNDFERHMKNAEMMETLDAGPVFTTLYMGEVTHYGIVTSVVHSHEFDNYRAANMARRNIEGMAQSMTNDSNGKCGYWVRVEEVQGSMATKPKDQGEQA